MPPRFNFYSRPSPEEVIFFRDTFIQTLRVASIAASGMNEGRLGDVLNTMDFQVTGAKAPTYQEMRRVACGYFEQLGEWLNTYDEPYLSDPVDCPPLLRDVAACVVRLTCSVISMMGDGKVTEENKASLGDVPTHHNVRIGEDPSYRTVLDFLSHTLLHFHEELQRVDSFHTN